jgi:hypothetical protein
LRDINWSESARCGDIVKIDGFRENIIEVARSFMAHSARVRFGVLDSLDNFSHGI